MRTFKDNILLISKVLRTYWDFGEHGLLPSEGRGRTFESSRARQLPIQASDLVRQSSIASCRRVPGLF